VLLENLHGLGELRFLAGWNPVFEIFDLNQVVVLRKLRRVKIVLVTFRHVTRSWLHELVGDAPFVGPSIRCMARDVEMLVHPRAETSVLIVNVVAAALRTHFLAEPIDQR
jgi:hypothetical protein